MIAPPTGEPCATSVRAGRQRRRARCLVCLVARSPRGSRLSSRPRRHCAKSSRLRPPAPETLPAAALRHDQATAEVLLGSQGVRAVLKRLMGIDEHFLGTGLSNPVDNSGYWKKASVHEYLIPNLPDDDPNVWMIRLKPFSLEMSKTIKELLQEDSQDRDDARCLKRAITTLCETKHPGEVVVRFAWLEESWYKHTLGPPARVRVFASEMTEVWDVRVKLVAGHCSGYNFNGGSIFFIWVFISGHGKTAVPATWGKVFDNLPMWDEDAEVSKARRRLRHRSTPRRAPAATRAAG